MEYLGLPELISGLNNPNSKGLVYKGPDENFSSNIIDFHSSYPYGIDNPKVFSRAVRSPFTWIVHDENITETLFVDLVDMIFSLAYLKELWFEKRFFLQKSWKRGTGMTTMKEVGHPLQPDVDLLYGACNKEKERKTPITGIEIKVFKYPQGNVSPKTTYPKEGYYSGVDQALSLTMLGLDYVYLWHVFVMPEAVFQKYREKYGNNFVDEVVLKDKIDSAEIYMASAESILPKPIGYVGTYFLVDKKNMIYHFIQPNYSIRKPLLNPLLEKDKVAKLRKILHRELQIEG